MDLKTPLGGGGGGGGPKLVQMRTKIEYKKTSSLGSNSSVLI